MTNSMSEVHVLALIKGLVEGDPYQHFGSLLGFTSHSAAAQELGLVTLDFGSDELAITDTGRGIYDGYKLESLPDGRANYWQADNAGECDLNGALADLARRWTARPRSAGGQS